MTQTPQLQQVLEKAKLRAEKNNRPSNVVDLFIEISQIEKYKNLIQSFTGASTRVIDSISSLFEAVPGLNDHETLSREYSQILTYSEQSSKELDNGFFDVEHVFHQLLNSSVTIRGWAEIANFPIDRIEDVVERWVLLKEDVGQEIHQAMSSPDFPTLENFCTNLSQKVANDDGVCFGREKEIQQVLDALCRQKKSNVLLMGEPGVGRKTIVQGVIEKILSGESSEIVRQKEFFLVNVANLVAGTAMFGSLESRFINLIKDAEAHGQCVLVIENINQVFGNGGIKDSHSDVSNLLRPILDKSNVSVIGICTQSEYKKIEKEQSFVSKFEIVRVSEPSKEETRRIVVNSVSELEYYHHVDIPIETIDTILDLCEKFLPYKKFPEKAFDVLDDIGAKAKNKHFLRPESLAKLEQKLAESFDPNAKEGSTLYKKMEDLVGRYTKALNKWINKVDSSVPVVSPEQAVSAFAEKYSITENQLKQLKTNTIDDIRARIKENVFGQDHAVDMVMDALLLSKTGLRDKGKPLAKFLFVGPTSVGKTEIAKQLAFNFFGDEKNLLKLDMSEFQDRSGVAALIGASAGYVGYGDGGRLTEYVKHNPNCVVLFDEVEKCSLDVLNLLLQIMDDGYVTDGQGFRVDFTNTIICMTSNLGSGDAKTSVGFLNSKEGGSRFIDAVKKRFSPEWIARLDEVVPFNDMSDEMLEKIINKCLKNTKDKLVSSISVVIEDSVVQMLLKKLKGQDAHARNVQGTVRKDIEIPLAKFISTAAPKKVTISFGEKLEIS